MLQDNDEYYEDPPTEEEEEEHHPPLKKQRVTKKEKDLQKALADRDLMILKLQQQQQQPPPMTPIKSEPIATAAAVISPSEPPVLMSNKINTLSTAEAFMQSRLLAADLKKSYEKASMEEENILLKYILNGGR